MLFVFIASCNGQNQTTPPEDSISQIESNLPDSISIITDFNTIYNPNAPKRITRKIRQDKEGNLLIAAFEDIIRHDGNSFTNFTKEEGLDSCDAFDVLEDRKGNIWIASTHFGVFHYAPSIKNKTGRKAFTQFTTKDGLAHNRTMCLYEDRAGNIWIGTQGGASCFYPSASLKAGSKPFRNFTTKDGLTHNDINTIMEDRTGKIWFGTRGTACVYDPSTSTFTEIKNDEGKPFENVWSIIEDKRGYIWLNGGGLWRYDPIRDSFTHITDMVGICIYEDKKGNIWFNTGLFESGLSRFDEKSLLSEKPIATQVFKGLIGMYWGISEDKEGNIWVGGGDGVWRYDGKTVTYYTGK